MIIKFLSILRLWMFFVFLLISLAISCVIILFSIAETVKKKIVEDIKNMGADVLNLSPIYYNKNNPDDKNLRGEISYDDLLALNLKRRCKGIKRIAPVSSGGKDIGFDVDIKLEEKKYSFYPSNVNLQATVPDYQKIKRLKVVKGRFINNIDVKLKRRVCVLGNSPYLFFGGEKVISKKIKLFGEEWIEKEDRFKSWSYSLTIVGALAKTKPFALPMSDDFLFEDGMVIIPYSVLEEILKTINPTAESVLWNIYLQIDTSHKERLAYEYLKPPKSKEEWESKIKKDEWVYDKEEGINVHKSLQKEVYTIINALKEKYGKDKKFYISSESRLLDELESQTKQANTFIATIGGISLLASIIGILSIMLLSVTNRTSEIGVRRAFGARRKDIFFQFIIEALTITGIGGVFGIIFGIMGSYLIGWYASWEMIIPWYSIILALGCVFIIAIIGGTYPAYRASCISPAVAVKYE